MRWLLPEVDSAAVSRLARELHVSLLVARLLVLRGLKDPAQASVFLEPRLSHLHDPCQMADMRAAVERVRRAIERQEKILIYGDYDVDGTMAVVVLLTALRSLGARVEAYIPHRLTDGYGMRAPVVERAAADGFHVVLSVDTGIREHEVLSRAQELGVDCIVTDHHLPEDRLPPAYAVLNPCRPDCPYPDKNLSGVGVAFKLGQALLGGRLTERVLRSYLKVVAVGTIADVVPLTGENRIIAHFGLQALREPGQPGLRSLLEVAGLAGRALKTSDVAFQLAPRLNAAGRMEDARDVIELLTTRNAQKARAIAARLEDLNRQRQRAEDAILKEIEARIQRDPEQARRYSLVFAGEGWHRGVIGIVAQRVVDRYYRPVLVVGVENGTGVGSGRSIKGFHLVNALTQLNDLFQRYGGHAQAAGFTIPATRLSELERRFEGYARAVLRPADLEPTLPVDAEISLAELDQELLESIKRLEPFGFGNPTPVFAARRVRVLGPPRILKDKHLKIRVAQGKRVLDALGWRQAGRGEGLSSGQVLDLAFALDENEFQGVSTLQLLIRDLRPAE